MRIGSQGFDRAPTAPPGDDGRQEDENALSPRQRQILDLLRQGKANKEIATQLGIGVGTVKQHVVALYKKLNVSNRAMAVSRGMGLGGPSPATRGEAAGLDLTPGCVFERRLTVVLTLEDSLPQPASGDLFGLSAARLLRRTAAALAQDHDAVLVARDDGAVDFVFGVHSIRDDDAQRALRAARDVLAELAMRDTNQAARLRGALAAGLSMTSMAPTGGWTGELLASAALGQARELARAAGPGELLVAGSALDLLDAGPRAEPGTLRRLRLGELERWPRRRRPLTGGLVGRAGELRALDAALTAVRQGRGGLIVLSGDGGMGKTALVETFAALARSAGVDTALWTAMPHDLPGAEDGRAIGPGGVERVAANIPAPPGAVTILDDAHALPPPAIAALAEAWRNGNRRGLLIVAGRPGAALSALPVEDAVPLRVGHLEPPALRALLEAFDLRPEAALGVAELAGGVPLFAVELARAARAGEPLIPPPPALLAVIQARLNALRLDRRVLARVCRTAQGARPEDAASGLPPEQAEQALARAKASGVVREDEQGRLRVPHPLLRAVLDAVLVE